MNKHSPGPWKWEAASHLYGGDEPGERRVLACPEHWVLSTHPDDDKIIVTPEDAALIAAAPEMLELLRELNECGDLLAVSAHLAEKARLLLDRFK